MKRARSSEVFLGGRWRARRRVAPLLAAVAFAYLLFVSVKLAGLGGADPAAVSRPATAAAGDMLQRRLEEPALRARAAGGAIAGYGRITGEILRLQEAGGGRRRWGLRGNFSELERMAGEAWALGSKAWEEASAFTGDVDSIVSGDGGATKCPSSLALGGRVPAVLAGGGVGGDGGGDGAGGVRGGAGAERGRQRDCDGGAIRGGAAQDPPPQPAAARRLEPATRAGDEHVLPHAVGQGVTLRRHPLRLQGRRPWFKKCDEQRNQK